MSLPRPLLIAMSMYWGWVTATEPSWYSVFFTLFFAYQAYFWPSHEKEI